MSVSAANQRRAVQAELMSEHSKTRSEEPLRETASSETPRTVEQIIGESVTTESAARQHSVDTVFSVLTEPGHRYVLTYLLQSDGPATVAELVGYVIKSTETTMTDGEFRRRVTVKLVSTHLPALDEAGFVRYDAANQLVTQTLQTALTEPYLRVALLQSTLAESLC